MKRARSSSPSTASEEPYRGYSQYEISISAAANSTLPPIVNAVEVYSVINTTNVGTDAQDGT
jgi:hypothetical protein